MACSGVGKKFLYRALIVLAVLSCLSPSALALSLDEAVARALQYNPDIRIQMQALMASEGDALVAAAPYDWTLTAGVSRDREDTPLNDQDRAATGVSELRTDRTSYALGAQKMLPFGWTVSTQLEAGSSTETLSDLQGIPRQNQMVLSANVQIPLLRGAGGGRTRAVQRASLLQAQASYYELQTRTTEVIFQVFLSYWQYRAEQQLLDVAEQAVRRSQRLLDDVSRLIEADELPQSELLLLEASHADRVYAHLAAEQARDQARDELGRLMGLSSEATLSLSPATDALPTWLGDDEALRALLSAREGLVRLAVRHRPELASLKTQLEAAGLLVDGAQNDLKPQLDFLVTPSYKQLSEHGSEYGFVADHWEWGAGPSLSLALRYEFPVGRRAARGQLQRELAQQTQLEITHYEQHKAIAVAVPRLVEALERMVDQEQRLQRALTLYESIVRQEVEKQRLGMSTLIDVVSVEDRYQSAHSNFIRHQLELASTLASLRFQTATLVTFAEAESRVLQAEVGLLSLGDPAVLLDLL